MMYSHKFKYRKIPGAHVRKQEEIRKVPSILKVINMDFRLC